VDPPGQSGVALQARVWPRGFDGDAVDLPGLGRQARRRSITWQFCFGAVPYTAQRHDCRDIIAVTAGRVHAIGGRITRAAVASRIIGRKPGCSCAGSQAAAFRCSSAAIAIGATSTALTARPARVGDRCMQLGGATRRAAAAGPDMRRGRTAIGHANTTPRKIK